ncbi:hypothetical protein BC938DRAFT_472508 [Jimgerdemannia flammicorona]|uniref:Uncharacterized protein n=1 Tax=Jimgerdemannia flammicorona TaxID=994334 RepID=A0A433Q5Y5_9FUNG|nr:hypothetical protein BC938DRAFT_472508 [Jimgerdemannia flammicorona]
MRSSNCMPLRATNEAVLSTISEPIATGRHQKAGSRAKAFGFNKKAKGTKSLVHTTYKYFGKYSKMALNIKGYFEHQAVGK